MRKKAEAFDQWIRTSFVAINTELEDLYFAHQDRARVLGVGDSLKERLRDEDDNEADLAPTDNPTRRQEAAGTRAG